MKLVVMLGDVLRSLLLKPATQRYPFQRREAPERLRGAVCFDPRACTGCNLCAMDCPADALGVITLDKAAKRFVLRYRLDRCTFCAQCVQSCRHGCLSLSSRQWELAACSTDRFTLYLGNDADVQSVLAAGARSEPAPSPVA